MDYTEINTAWGDHSFSISPTLGDKFKELAAAVRDCILSLDVPEEQQDHLIYLVGELIHETEENAVSEGIDYGIRYTAAAIEDLLSRAKEDQDGKARPPPGK